ncbi:MAG: cupin domain-containing protein [Chitinispirillaceae bacterium]|nr:cupin domain-containing protein [Chitinispirillaceae bacterium]
MSDIAVNRQAPVDEVKKRGILNWPVWEKEVSRFDWYYDEPEECYFLEGKVVVEAKDGTKAEFGKGDLVKFPKGLACVWDIKEPVRKHYNFG